MKTAIISGTFDPVTVGHLNVVKRASRLFDRVVVAVSASHYKPSFLPDELRLEAVRASIKDVKNASAELCVGLLADFCSAFEEPVIVRGVRSAEDFEYERDMYAINKSLCGIETVLLPAQGELTHISSSFARELIKYGKSTQNVIPDGARELIEQYIDEAEDEKH